MTCEPRDKQEEAILDLVKTLGELARQNQKEIKQAEDALARYERNTELLLRFYAVFFCVALWTGLVFLGIAEVLK